MWYSAVLYDIWIMIVVKSIYFSIHEPEERL
jgi:hypothetical protein